MNQEPSSDYVKYPVIRTVNQSPPVNTEDPYDPVWVKGKTILITGGASGFGAGFAKRWALCGATVIIGDINTKAAEQVVANVRSESSSASIHFTHCNVTDWQSQVDFFKEAKRLSPHGGIDVVVANAGIAGVDNFEDPRDLDADAPPKPNFKTLEVNLIGVLYTAHLALYHLPRNPGSSISKPSANPKEPRDRHLLLLGSMASLGPIPIQSLYNSSKHGVLGLFRSLRTTSFVHGIRVNLLCPYFIDTPILPAPSRVILAGGPLGKPEDVVEAATRFVADKRIVGRSLYIGPRMKVTKDEAGDWQLAMKPYIQKSTGKEVAIWEVYADDCDDSEVFVRNMTRLLNQLTFARGWLGYFADLWKAIKYGLGAGRKGILGRNS